MAVKKSVEKKSVKTAKKPVVKKKAGVKSTSKEQKAAKKSLLRTPAEHAFYCNDGRLFYDLKELAEGLMAISEETFFHHVRDGNNDFSNWVRYIVGDEELANDLYRSSDKDECTTYIVARLDYYE
ncbi:MAG: hypothetical protein JXA01_06315 [Dehalococcoidia bacterium]|nr:hypothetical protein [Dehalococcoidia bacterium]